MAMEYLSEDPMPLAGFFLLVAVAFLVALRATQQGKYLVRAVIAGLLAGAVVLVEWFWVTDNERIEQVIYGLRDAVAISDVERVLGYMTPDVKYLKGDMALEGETTRGLIRDNLSRVRFDLVRISNLRTNAGKQSRRGTADFHALIKGTMDTSTASMTSAKHSSRYSARSLKVGSLPDAAASRRRVCSTLTARSCAPRGTCTAQPVSRK